MSCVREIRGASAAVCVLTSALFLTASPVDAQSTPPASGPQTRRTMAALKMEPGERIVLDGRLDEEVWSRAVPATDFVQLDPDNGQRATEQTDVRIVFDGESLYMGVTCFDSEPEKWLGYQRRRDEFLQADDRFMWNLDTYNNQLSSYFFEMNPSGLMGDALRGAGFQNRQWDGIWNAKVRHTDQGWVLEIEIPFRTLSFDPAADAWGINFQRTVRRKNEESLWTGWGRNQGLNRLSNAGLLTGLNGLQIGKGLDLKPYAVVSAESFPGRGTDETRTKASTGIDVVYSPTPRIRTNLTINTDFAQTEVDQRLTNLTRFPQFFPEKRDFFLDGSTFFDFQSTALGESTLLPYFTRRIGLDAGGNPQPVDIGGKLTGQFGSNDIGALYVRTRGQALDPAEDFAVVRVKTRILSQSYVGMLYTNRHATTGAGVRQTAAADFLLATSTFRGSEQLSVGGFFVNTSNPGQLGKGNAYGVTVEYPNDPWASTLLFREVQDNYDAAVGFTPRRGYRRLASNLSYTARPVKHRWIRSVLYGAGVNLVSDTREMGLLNRDLDLTMVSLTTHSGDTFQVHVVPTYEKLESNFQISPGLILPAGQEYRYTRYSVALSTAQRRVIAFGPSAEYGTFYDGTRRKLAATLNLRLRPGVIIYTAGEWNSVQLPAGSFQTRLVRIVPELQFSPWVSWVNNVQYDTQSTVVGWQSRFRWIMKPGNDLYLVYTHNWVDDPLQRRIYTLDRRIASKMLYTHRF